MMNFKSIQECEQKRTRFFLNYKLPNYWKKIGLIGAIVSLLVIMSTSLFDGNFELLKDVLRKVVLAFLLLMVLAREEQEDERIQNIRAQSFSFAFLAGVLYALFQPLVNLIVASIFMPDKASFEDLGDFQILWLMLTVYLLFFHFLKKRA
jgi:threonine/homoserine/homoserine lactone efflux protein